MTPITGWSTRREAIVWCLVAAGIVLRIITYLQNPGLYIDEAALAGGIVMRSFRQLFDPPLDYEQLAPLGFLIIQKVATLLLGRGEYALRLVSLLASIATLVCFVSLARHYLRSRSLVLAILLGVSSYSLVHYAASDKPYSVDVLVATGLLLLAVRRPTAGLTRRQALGVGLLGGVGAWFSHPAVLVLVGIALSDAVERFRRRARWQPLLACWLLWGVGAIPAIVVSRAYVRSPEYLAAFWRSGFLPLEPNPATGATWLLELPVRVMFDPLVLTFRLGGIGGPAAPVIYFVAALGLCAGSILLFIGVVAVLRRRSRDDLLLVAPIVTTLAASAVGAYPFGGDFREGGRVLLFLVPPLLLLIGIGVETVGQKWRRLAAVLSGALALELLAVWIVNPRLYLRQELRPVLEYVQRHRIPSDRLYVYYGALPAFEYYAPEYGIRPGEYTRGVCARLQPARLLADLEASSARGPTWFVFSHLVNLFGMPEHQLMLDYLNTLGRPVDSILAAGTMAIRYRFDTEPATPGARVTPYAIPTLDPADAHRYDCASVFGPRLRP